MNLFKRKKAADLQPSKPLQQWPIPTRPQTYPEGSFVETEAGLWYINDSQYRMRFISRRVLDSWNPQQVISSTEAAVSHYVSAGKMKFRNGSLIKNVSDGKMYLIVNHKRRHIQSPDALLLLNREESDCISVSEEEANLHEDGVVLN